MPEVSWFSRPTADRAGSLNACYQLLDRAVIAGRSDDEVVPGLSHARLLEDVASFAGVLRGFAIASGESVGVFRGEQHDPLREVVVRLALARIGAVATDTEAGPARVRITDAVITADGHDLAYDAAMRLGRTDPAGTDGLAPDAPATPTRTVLQQAEALVALRTPLDVGSLLDRLR